MTSARHRGAKPSATGPATGEDPPRVGSSGQQRLKPCELDQAGVHHDARLLLPHSCRRVPSMSGITVGATSQSLFSCAM